MATKNEIKRLSRSVRDDIKFFLSHNTHIFSCEAEFQLLLARFLQNSPNNYDKVFVEYYVPKSELKPYEWDQDMNIDIVVKKDCKFVPVELKYKTKEVFKEYHCFNQELKDIEILRNQSAINIGTYDFWKDVRRLEILANNFQDIVDGFAVLLTNDGLYLEKRGANCHSVEMSTDPGMHDKSRHWGEGSTYINSKSRPSFDLDNWYDVKWKKCVINEEIFHYCIINLIK